MSEWRVLLDDGHHVFEGYACPWCPVIVVDVSMPAVRVFEHHLDRHIAAGDHQHVGAA